MSKLFEMTDTQKADRLYEIDQTMAKLKKEQDDLKNWLKEALEPGESIQATNKVKFVVSTTQKRKYSPEAAFWLRENAPQALEMCASISESKLQTAKRAGFLDAADLAVLESWSEVEEVATIRRNNKEAQAEALAV